MKNRPVLGLLLTLVVLGVYGSLGYFTSGALFVTLASVTGLGRHTDGHVLANAVVTMGTLIGISTAVMWARAILRAG